MRHLVFFATATAFLLPSAASAKESTTLKPSSNWNVDYGAQTCRLSRLFGEGDNRHLIYFEQWGPSSSFGFTASGKGLNRFRPSRPTYLQINDDQERVKVRPMIGNVEQVGKAIIFSNLGLADSKQASEEGSGDTNASIPQLDTQKAGEVRYIAFTQGSQKVLFETGDLDEAFKVLNQCSQSLITEWGLDLEQHKQRSRDVIWLNKTTVVRRITDIYPSSARNRGEQGIVRLRVIVDENGKVTECFIGKVTDKKSSNLLPVDPCSKQNLNPPSTRMESRCAPITKPA